jgi:hydroxyacylglutathione hydrolase
VSHEPIARPRNAGRDGPVVVSFLAAGLGDRSYLVVGDDRAVMVDPQRDVEPYLAAAEAQGARLTHVLETHVHNDYVSGGLELARRSGAELVMPKGSGASFSHREAGDGDLFESDRLRIQAIHTPGHTLEHTSFLIETGDAAPLLFSGGSLLAGSAGRTDLAGPALTDRLTALQYGSVRRLAALPAQTQLHPTHGAGSFCTASPAGGEGVSTIGQERAANSALADEDPLSFARRQLHGLLRYPTYYAQMAPINRRGPSSLGAIVAPPPLTPGQTASLRAVGVPVVDARPRAAFARGHIPGSLNIELDDSFGTYVGWILPFDSPLVLVLDRAQDVIEPMRQLLRIGFDRVRGMLIGIDQWEGEGREVRSFRQASLGQLREALADLKPPRVLDVRQPSEWDEGIIPGSIQRFVADLEDAPIWLAQDRPVWTICRSGHRSSIAASILAGKGYEVVAVDGGGVPDLLAAI